MFAALQKGKRDFMMRIGRRSDRSCVHQFGKFLKRPGRSDAVFFYNRTRSRKIDIVNGGEIRGRNFGVKSRVIASDMADADHANAKFVHLATFSNNQS